ncbi:MAG: type II toxin-antitoxin system RelB/DinJ family antitoxin [Sedimenticola sp.]
MSKVIVQSRVSKELKDEAETVFSAMGLTVAEAIRLFLNQTVTDYRFPFVPKLRQPTPEFHAALHELDEGKAERFDDMDKLFASWDKET